MNDSSRVPSADIMDAIDEIRLLVDRLVEDDLDVDGVPALCEEVAVRAADIGRRITADSGSRNESHGAFER